MHKLLIVTAVAGLSIVAISAWQNRPAAKLEQFQQQMIECTALVQPFDTREATKCINDLTAQIERAK